MSDIDANEAITTLMNESGISRETLLYRRTLREFLTESDGVLRVSANQEPSEAVVDVYEGGHMAQASDIGPGLAFVQGATEEWASPDRELIVVKLGAVLDQGGRIYPVASVVTEKVWYLTLPGGEVEVARA
jgi:hypothetical protein